VNGGLARRGGRRVKPLANIPSEWNVVSLPHRESGRGRAQGSGWREIVIQRFKHRQKRCVDWGTRGVTARWSWEESLSTEGIPDHEELPSFTRRQKGWSRRSSHPPTRKTNHKGGYPVSRQLPRRRKRREGEQRVATGMSEARSDQHLGKRMPGLVLQLLKRARGQCCMTICRSGLRTS
jgi:hypothetical protein